MPPRYTKSSVGCRALTPSLMILWCLSWPIHLTSVLKLLIVIPNVFREFSSANVVVQCSLSAKRLISSAKHKFGITTPKTLTPISLQSSASATCYPCYNDTTLCNRLYAQHKGPNMTNLICWSCKIDWMIDRMNYISEKNAVLIMCSQAALQIAGIIA